MSSTSVALPDRPGVDFTRKLSRALCKRIFRILSLRDRVAVEAVSKRWRQLILETYQEDQRPIWLYCIFRRNRVSGHHFMAVRIGMHGPIFWGRQIAYVYACCCHFGLRHETSLRSLLSKLGLRVDRLCLVDSPMNFAFLSDSFLRFTFQTLRSIQWLYLRELDLEPVTTTTVEVIAELPVLKRMILHHCRNYDALKNFDPLPQLVISHSEIKGLLCFEEVEKHLRECEEQVDMASVEDCLRNISASTANLMIRSGKLGQKQLDEAFESIDSSNSTTTTETDNSDPGCSSCS